MSPHGASQSVSEGPGSGWPGTAVRWVLGVVLIAAALMKWRQMASLPFDAWPSLGPVPLILAQIAGEAMLAIWLLSGLYTRPARAAASAAFLAFVAVSLWKVIKRDASCGCFGQVNIPPAFMLGFDILALLALSFTRKDARSARTSHPSRWILAALLALIASTAFAGIWLKRPSQSVVYFEPSDWLGKPLPLLAYMDIGHRLEKGRWIVVIYNSYCGHCRPVIPEYEQLAVQWTGRQDVPGIALIELPPPAPPGRNPATGQTSALLGHLAAQRKWFIITPAIMAIENGRVVAVAGEEPPATWASQAFDRR